MKKVRSYYFQDLRSGFQEAMKICNDLRENMPHHDIRITYLSPITDIWKISFAQSLFDILKPKDHNIDRFYHMIGVDSNIKFNEYVIYVIRLQTNEFRTPCPFYSNRVFFYKHPERRTKIVPMEITIYGTGFAKLWYNSGDITKSMMTIYHDHLTIDLIRELFDKYWDSLSSEFEFYSCNQPVSKDFYNLLLEKAQKYKHLFNDQNEYIEGYTTDQLRDKAIAHPLDFDTKKFRIPIHTKITSTEESFLESFNKIIKIDEIKNKTPEVIQYGKEKTLPLYLLIQNKHSEDYWTTICETLEELVSNKIKIKIYLSFVYKSSNLNERDMIVNLLNKSIKLKKSAIIYSIPYETDKSIPRMPLIDVFTFANIYCGFGFGNCKTKKDKYFFNMFESYIIAENFKDLICRVIKDNSENIINLDL